MSETIPGTRDTDAADAAAGAHDARISELLEAARRIAETVLAPRAQETDQAGAPPVDNVRRLAEAGLLGLSTPVRYGGHGAPGWVLRAYTETLAAACGVTTFVEGQHLSACAMIAGGENDRLKETLLPLYARGERMCGVSFAHLRRPGPPTMRVCADGGGYVFDGVAPWFTGYGLMDDVMLGGTLEDGRLLYVVVPLEQGGALAASPPMRLCAMDASGTVSLTARSLRVGADRAMKTITLEQMGANDLAAILGVVPQIFGVSTASIALVRSLAERRRSDMLHETARALDAELADLRAEVDRWRDRTADPDYKAHALAARARCITFGVRAAHAAVTAMGGGANALDNPAQRLFREAMFYTLTAQTRDVQAATLDRLAGMGDPFADG